MKIRWCSPINRTLGSRVPWKSALMIVVPAKLVSNQIYPFSNCLNFCVPHNLK